MDSYSFEKAEVSGELFRRAWQEINEMHLYYKKVWGSDYEEAMHRSLMHSINHYDESVGDWKPYIKSLASTINRPSNKEICVDFIENVAEDWSALDDYAQKKTGCIRLQPHNDFSGDLIEGIWMSMDRTDEVQKLALDSMSWFLKLCESYSSRNSGMEYYPVPFKESVRSLLRKCNQFMDICLKIYDEYGDSMKQFLSLDSENVGSWIEADYTYIGTRESKRVTLVSPATKEKVFFPDVEDFVVKGSMKDKKIVRVRFIEQHEAMLDLVDSDVSNQMKFIVGNHYITRTLGGSVSIVDAELSNTYSLIEDEILTNLLRDTKSSYLTVGKEYIYLLCKSDYDLSIPERTIRGIKLQFEAEEVDACVLA